MKKSYSRHIVFYAMMTALITVALILDTVVGTFWLIKPAIFSLPTVFVFALIKKDWKNPLIALTLFGVLSFIRAFIVGSIPFQNPLISIVPRMLVGGAVLGAYSLFRLIFGKGKRREVVAVGFAAAIGMMTNTVTVVSAIYLFGDGTTLMAAFQMLIALNVPIELVTATMLTPLLVCGVRRGLRMNFDGTVDTPVIQVSAEEISSSEPTSPQEEENDQ